MTCRVRLSDSIILDLHSKAFMESGFRCFIAGESGSGKSSATALIMEQVLASHGQILCLDLHGEYENLWATAPGNIVRIGYGQNPVTEDSVEWCIDVLKSGKSLFIDLSHWADVYQSKLDSFVLTLMRAFHALRRRQPKWTLVVLEEAQGLIPQNQSPGQNENVKTLLGLITGGRNYGIQFILASQRSSLVDINALSQMNVRLFLRISETADWKRIASYIPVGLFPPKQGYARMKRFPAGRAVFVSQQSDVIIQLHPATVKLRKPLMDALAAEMDVDGELAGGELE